MRKPSVTKLIDLLAKPALIRWANRLGLEGVEVDAYRKAKKESGIQIHSQIERACKGEDAFDHPSHAEAFTRFMADKTTVANEEKIETDWFVGRFDFAFDDADGIECIADFKRGFKGKLYLEHKLQLVAYTMARPANMAIVSVPSFELFPVTIADRKPYEQMLIKLSELYRLLKEIEVTS